jgi:hypothetical protein
MGEEAIRADDAEREETVLALREHAAHGRLEVDELDERIQKAYVARTRGELVALMRDLPMLPAPPPARREHPDVVAFKRKVASVAVLLVFLIGIWAASGGGYFWPVWPALGLGVALGLHGAQVAWRRPERDEDQAQQRRR